MYTVIRHQLKREAKIRTDENIELGDVAKISREFRKGQLEDPPKDAVRVINLSITFCRCQGNQTEIRTSF